jgi:hypothetical protein
MELKYENLSSDSDEAQEADTSSPTTLGAELEATKD